MEKKFSLTNKRFGSLLVVWRVASKRVGVSSHSWWACKCDCGTVVEVRGSSLTNGRMTHCGCKNQAVFTQGAHA